jgi:hypothetical protein
MTKHDPVEAGIRGLGAVPVAAALHGGDLEVARAEQLAALRNDFMAKRLNCEDVWTGVYPDPAAAGFHPDIHPELELDPETNAIVVRGTKKEVGE